MLHKSKDFNMGNEVRIKDFVNKNNGYITTTDFLNMHISKPMIKKYLDAGLIERVGHGIYMDPKLFEDEYYILQKRYPFVVFSYNIALDMLNLTNRTPMNVDVTVPRGKTIRGDYHTHYVSEKYYDIGIIEIISPFGNPVRIYNAERCICDMFKNEDEFELELKNRILDYYWHYKDKNLDQLFEYAKVLKVYDKVKVAMEIMMKW